MQLKKYYNKYKDIIPYLFFGVCTTLVNIFVYWFMAHILFIATMASTVIAWVAAVLFAYVTNRKWVFHSEARESLEIIREILSFFGCRLGTGFVDWFCMYLFVDVLSWNDIIIKTIANIIVIVLNYVFSKLVIFKRKR